MRTDLYERHAELGAKFVDFGGWEMPLHYSKGIVHEHQVVRNAVGIFDISHMGRIDVQGGNAEFFLDYLSTNQIVGNDDGTVTYTVWCSENGRCVDDLLIFKKQSNDCFVVTNAANRQKDLEHMNRYLSKYPVQITPRFSEGILAIQGPNSLPLMHRFFPASVSLKYMHFMVFEKNKLEVILSRTGYTGSPGFEIYAPSSLIQELWDRFLKEGKEFGIEPIGLGARDTLRLEMGYALYGHELSDHIAPTESVASRTVKWSKPDFIGMQSLKSLTLRPQKRNAYAVLMQEKGIPRQGYKVFQKGMAIGEVTSGSFSPTLTQGIALILVRGKLASGDTVQIQIREALVAAKVVPLPFVKSLVNEEKQ